MPREIGVVANECNCEGKRFCIFYTSGCVSPALGGIMAGAIISRLDGVRGIAGWRWLFLVEGVVTVFCGFVRKSRYGNRYGYNS
jgi:hypothetical protein